MQGSIFKFPEMGLDAVGFDPVHILYRWLITGQLLCFNHPGSGWWMRLLAASFCATRIAEPVGILAIQWKSQMTADGVACLVPAVMSAGCSCARDSLVAGSGIWVVATNVPTARSGSFKMYTS